MTRLIHLEADSLWRRRWLAQQVLANEFADASREQITQIVEQLLFVPDELCERALEKIILEYMSDE